MWQRPTVAAWREPNLLPHRQQARRRLQRHGAVVWLTSMALWLAGVAIAGVWVEHERDATLATYQDWQRRTCPPRQRWARPRWMCCWPWTL